MTIGKKFLSILLVVLMVLQSAPIALADGGQTTRQPAFTAVSEILEGETYHKVTFDTNGDGQEDIVQYVENGSNMILPEDPSVDQSDFNGWFAGGTQITQDNLAVTGDMTITAQHTEILKYKFTVNFIDENRKELQTSAVYEYTEADELPVVEDASSKYFSMKYVTVDVPQWIEVAAEGSAGTILLFPKQTSVTFYLDGKETAPTVDVIYMHSTVKYTVKHLLAKRGADGYKQEYATLEDRVITTQTTDQADKNKPLQGAVGATVLMEPLDSLLDHHVYLGEKQLILSSDETQNVGYIWYHPKEYVLNYDSQGGTYVEPKIGYYGEEMAVYSMQSNGGYICGVEEHQHSDSCYESWDRYRWFPQCGLAVHTHGAECEAPATYSPAPIRTGYTFAGWYMNADINDPDRVVANDQPAPEKLDSLDGDTTVYAKWEPANAPYTIMYMREVYDNSTNSTRYEYIDSAVAMGLVGHTPSLTANQETAHKPSKGYGGAVVDYHPILADGSSITTVYYNLAKYTITFDLNDTRNVQGTITMNGKEYHGTEYKLEVYLGQDISALWPTPDKVTRSNGNILDTWNDTYKTIRFEVTEDMLPNSGTSITYEADWITSGTKKAVVYWLQNPDDPTEYIASTTYSQEFYQDNGSLDPKEIFGFKNLNDNDNRWTPGGSYPANEQSKSSVTVGTGDNQVTFTGLSTVYNYYYDRLPYEIDYKYMSIDLKSKSNILFGQDISGEEFSAGVTADDVNALITADSGVDKLPAGSTFKGWYAVMQLPREDYPAYNFGTMPAGNLVLYAIFDLPENDVTMYNVFPNGDSYYAPQLYKEPYSVPYGTPIGDLPESEARAGFTFIGWFTSPDGGEPIDPNKPVTQDTSVYAHWKRNILSYTVMYLEQGTDKELADPLTEETPYEIGQPVTVYPLTIAGYRPVEAEGEIILSGDNAENVKKFYYVARDQVAYTIKYVYQAPDGSETLLDTENLTAEKEAERLILFPRAIIEGTRTGNNDETMPVRYYPITKMEEMILTTNPEDNVVTFYYNAYKSASVTIEFCYEGTHDDSKKIEKPIVLVGQSVYAGLYANDDTYTKNGEYKFTSADPQYNITITEADDAEHLTMVLHFEKNTAAYQINHYLKETTIPVADPTKGSATIGHPVEVSPVTSASYPTAKFNSYTAASGATVAVDSNTGNGILTINQDAAKNVIDMYYTMPLIINAGSNTVTYDGTAKTVDYTFGDVAGNGMLYNGDTVTATVEYYVNGAWVAQAPVNAGSYPTRIASYDLNGNPYYRVTTNNGLLVINQAEAGELSATPGVYVYDAQPHTFTLTGVDTAKGDKVSYAIAAAGQTRLDDAMYTLTTRPQFDAVDTLYSPDNGKTEGKVPVYVKVENSNYETRYLETYIQILRRPLVLSAEATAVYNGAEQYLSITSRNVQIQDLPNVEDGLVSGQTLKLEGAVIAGTDVGEYTTLRAGGSLDVMGNIETTHNYAITLSGKLTITKRPVVFTGESDVLTYNGTEQSLTGIEDNFDAAAKTGLVAGHVLKAGSLTYLAKSKLPNDEENVTYPQEYPGVFSGTPVITIGSGEDAPVVTDNYTFEYVPGKLTIIASDDKVPASFASKVLPYNGETQYLSPVTVGKYNGNQVTGEIIQYTLTEPYTDDAGKLVIVDPFDSITAEKLGAKDVDDGTKTIYAVVTCAGYQPNILDATLRITPIAARVVSQTPAEPFTYNGEKHNYPYVTSTGFVAGEGVVIDESSFATIQDMGTVSNTFTIDEKATEEKGTKLSNYSIAVAYGTLSMIKRTPPITVTPISDSKVYDGTALTYAGTTYTSDYETFVDKNGNVVPNPGYTVSGAALATGDRLAVTLAGAQTEAGQTWNQVTHMAVERVEGENKVDASINYTLVRAKEATLTVTQRPLRVTGVSETHPFKLDSNTKTAVTQTVKGVLSVEVQIDNGEWDDLADWNNHYSVEGVNLHVIEGDVVGTYTGEFDLPALIIRNGYDADVTSSFKIETVPGTLTIEKADVGADLQVIGYDGYYDGVAHDVDVVNTAGRFTTLWYSLKHDPANPDATVWTKTRYEYTDVTDGPVTVYVKATNPNFKDRIDSATINIKPIPLSVTGSATYTYNGKAQSLTLTAANLIPDSVSRMVKGEELELTYTVSGTNDKDNVQKSGEPITTGWSVKKANGDDSTGNYTLKASYSLTIKPAPVQVIGWNGNTVYNGQEQFLSGVEGYPTDGIQTVSGMADGHELSGLTFDANGTIFGSYEGSFTGTAVITKKDGTDTTENYVIETVPGWLVITPITNEITIEANPLSKIYDGEPLVPSNNDYTSNADDILVGEDRLEVVMVGSQINAYNTGDYGKKYGQSPSIVESYKVVNAAGKDVTANYSFATPVNSMLTVHQRPVMLTSGSAEKVYDGDALTNSTVTISSDDPNSQDYVAGYYGLVKDHALILTTISAPTEVGNHGNSFTRSPAAGTTWDDLLNYDFATTNGILTITARPIVIVGETATRSYTGEEQKLTGISVTGVEGNADSGLVKGHALDNVSLTYVAKGTVASEDPYHGVFTGEARLAAGDADVTDNYEITQQPGALTITANEEEIVITANSNKKVYDGTALTDDGYTYTEGILHPDDKLTAVVEGTQTNAGSSANEVKSYKVTNKAGEDVTSSYTFGESVNGTLTVTKRKVTLTSATDEKVYDGIALTNDTITEVAEGFETAFPQGEKLNYKVTGKQLDEGSSKNTFSYEAGNTSTDLNNYEIETVEGTLTVTPITTEIVITANSNEKVYDGTALTDAGYTYTENVLVKGDILTAVVEGTQTNAGSSANAVTSYKVMRGETDVTGNYTFGKSVDGTLTVTARKVTLTSATATKVYDGIALTKDAITVTGDGLVDGEKLAYTVTGAQLDVGSSKNTFSYKPADTKLNLNNYEIETVEGTLTVTPITTEIVITANSNEKVYDGTALTDAGYTYTENVLVKGDILTAVVEGTQTDAGSSDNAVTSYKVMRGETDVTGNYTFGESVDGTLTVTARKVTLTSATLTAEYAEGKALTNGDNQVVITGDGFAPNEGVTYTFTGKQQYVGSSENSFEYHLLDGMLATNYVITKVFGTLTVTGDSLVTDKTIPNVKSNYALGETIEYAIYVQNVRDEVITNVAVYDENAVILSGEGYTVTGDHAAVIPTLAVGATVTIKAQHIVTSQDILEGTVGNTATVTWGDETFYPEAEDVETEDLDTTLKVVKTSNVAADETASLNETITYTIAVTNEGNVPYTNVKVADGLKGATIVATDTKYEVVDGVALIDELAVGETVNVTVTYTVTEADILNGKVVNTATAQGDPIDDPKDDTPKTPKDDDKAEVETDDLNTALKVVKTSNVAADETVSLGQVITYKITVTNEGNVTYPNVVVEDELEGATIASGAGYTVKEGKAVIAKLAVGETVTITATYTVTEADILTGKVINTATAKGDPIDDPKTPGTPQKPEDKDETEDETDDLNTAMKVVKTSNVAEGETVSLGQVITYKIIVTNEGNVTYPNVVVEDELEGATIASGAGYTVKEGKAVIAKLAVGETVTITATYTVTEADILNGKVINTATAKGDPIDDPKTPGTPQKPEDKDETEDETDDLNTALKVVKTSNVAEGEKVSLGQKIIYMITVTNEGNVTYPNVVVEDKLAGVEIVSGAGYIVKEGKAVIAKLAVGETVTITATYTVTKADILKGWIVNNVVVEGDPIDDPKNPDTPKTPEDEDEVKVETDDIDTSMSLTKTTLGVKNGNGDYVAKTEYAEGDVVYYLLTVKNLGNVDFHNVLVTDERAAYAETIETLAVGETVEITVSVTATELDILDGKLVNVATAAGDPVNDPKNPEEPKTPNASGETEDDMEDIDSTLTVEKTTLGVKNADGAFSLKDKYALGDEIFYRITVTNEGNVTYFNVTVKDAYTGMQETIDIMSAGDTAEFTTSQIVTSEHILAGVILNVATAEGDLPAHDPDQNPGQPSGSDTEENIPEDIDTSLSVDKYIRGVKTDDGYVTKAAYSLGDKIYYGIKVTNEGNVPYKNIRVVDPYTGLDEIIPVLAVGETVTFKTSLKVTEKHIEKGEVLNIVTAEGEIDGEVNPNLPAVNPQGKDEVHAPTVPNNYAVMNVGDCFE